MTARPVLVLLCGLAFLFQAFIAQTHIHGAGGDLAFARTVVAGTHHPAPAPDQNPRDDLNKCPFCQVAVAVGAAIGPNLLYVVEPPVSGVVEALREIARPAQASRPYIWRSRGPPQH